jgi:aryl-alcohol dehydrogenase-like predicted oxidoreductase
VKFRKLGKNGPEVSVVGLGCNNFGGRLDEEGSRRVIDRAIEAGITLFDTADIYGNKGGSESIIGRALGSRRKDIVLATKFGGNMDDAGTMKGASAAYIERAAEASLKRLQTDVLDLYQIHLPDEETPLEETLRALDNLVRSGKVRYVGCSNHPAWKVVDSDWIALTQGLTGFVSAQDEYSLLKREAEGELIPALRAKGLGLLPYFPLASGLLSGKYKREGELPAGTRFAGSPGLVVRYMTPENWERVERLTAFAESRGHTILELAFAWLLAQEPVSSVIAGATKPEQIEQNVAAGEWVLSSDDLAGVAAALE